MPFHFKKGPKRPTPFCTGKLSYVAIGASAFVFSSISSIALSIVTSSGSSPFAKEINCVPNFTYGPKRPLFTSISSPS